MPDLNVPPDQPRTIECVCCNEKFTIDTTNIFVVGERPTTLCPRCDTDNRVWLQLRYKHRVHLLPLTPWQVILYNVADWLDSFRSAVFGVGMVVVMGALAALMGFLAGLGSGATLLLFAGILFSNLAIMTLVTNRWPEIRKQQFISRYVGAKKGDASFKGMGPTIGLLSFSLVVVIPMMVIIGPRALAQVQGMVFPASPPPQEQTVQTLLGVYQEIRDSLSTEVLEAQKDIWETLDQGFAALRERTPDEPEPEPESPPEVASFSTRLFATLWFAGMLPTLVVTILVAYSAVKSHVDKINVRLSPPVFANVPLMMRLIQKELLQAIGEDRQHVLEAIQWRDVKRNESGGLRMVGVYAPPADEVRNNSLAEDNAIAHQYIVSTNLWGRIEVFEVKNMRVSYY